MVAIRTITQNTPDQYGGSHQTNPSWVVAFVTFNEENSLNIKTPTDARLIIVQNDCTSITINNSKSQYLKAASLNLKSTDVWYPGLITTGDWVFIWMHNSENESINIIKNLQKIKKGSSVGNALCDANSGLKFFGRVSSTNTLDSVGANGIRRVNQSIQAQSFLELSSSVYFNYGEATIASPQSSLASNKIGNAAIGEYQFNRLDGALKDYADKFYSFYYSGNAQWTPDIVSAIHLILALGMDKDTNEVESGVQGSTSQSIEIPALVSKIFGGTATKYWELLNVNLGIQKYDGKGDNWWEKFSPVFKDDGKIFKVTPTRCRGLVPYSPVLPNNQSIWAVANQYVNPVVNEFFTSLRINKEGKITPTITLREKPFSTGLFGSLPDTQASSLALSGKTQSLLGAAKGSASKSLGSLNPLKGIQDKAAAKDKDKPGVSEKNDLTKPFQKLYESMSDPDNRTIFGNLPRWLISDTMIRKYSYSHSEVNRVNFVQVWGSHASADFTGYTSYKDGTVRQMQYQSGNYQIIENDVKRHGLRSVILETRFDAFGASKGTLVSLFAKLNADWLFNGHLKAYGSVVLNGVVDPIVEGDNCQIRDIVYHINGVSHNASIDENGRKHFTTTLNLSNGLLMDGLESIDNPPKYPFERGYLRKDYDTPGYIEVQNNIK